MSLTFQIRRLARHSAIYGLGGILSRLLAVFLLPLYTAYLGTKGFGKIEIVTALSTVIVIVLSAGISSAFFRFYFDSKDTERRVVVVQTAFWFTMAMATVGLVLGWAFATPLAHLLKLGVDPWLVRAVAVGLWAQMNYSQLTNLFRVEERWVQFVLASVANILITVGMTVLLVVGLHKGPTGAVVGNFIGTLAVYLVLLGYRRYQLGLQFDRKLLREMNRFGLPLVPSALALWAITFIDRIFVNAYKGLSEAGEDPRAVESRLLPRRRGGRRPGVRRLCIRGLHGALDRDRPRAADPVQLDHQRPGGRAEHRAQLRTDSALRDDGRRDLDRSRLRRAVHRDGPQLAARLPGRLSVASRPDPQLGRCHAHRGRLRGEIAPTRDRALRCLSARAAAARLLSAGGACPAQAARAAPQLTVAPADVTHADANGTGCDEHECETA